jgi:hypothetical protein
MVIRARIIKLYPRAEKIREVNIGSHSADQVEVPGPRLSLPNPEDVCESVTGLSYT